MVRLQICGVFTGEHHFLSLSYFTSLLCSLILVHREIFFGLPSSATLYFNACVVVCYLFTLQKYRKVMYCCIDDKRFEVLCCVGVSFWHQATADRVHVWVYREAEAEHFTLNLCMAQLCSVLSGEFVATRNCHDSFLLSESCCCRPAWPFFYFVLKPHLLPHTKYPRA